MGTWFAILGPLVVERDGTPLDLGAPKQRAVLAFLAAHAGEPVSLDRLIDELWGDQAPPRATASLQAYVSNLRRILEPERPARSPATLLVSRPPGYALDVPPGALDAERFEQLTAEAAAALEAGDPAGALVAADEAVSLWRGEVLADFPYEPFAEPVRARLEERRLQAEQVRAEALLAAGRADEAAAVLDELTRTHPLRERLWELLMLARYRSGRQAEALRAYGEARQVLTDELGLEPGPALRRLEQRILEHDPGLDLGAAPPATDRSGARPAPAPLASAAPPTATASVAATATGDDLVGREAELAALSGAWADALDGRPRFAAVAGEPGIGKTSLARTTTAAAEQAGATVVWGRSHEQAGSAPLWLWVQVVRALVGAVEADGPGLAPGTDAVLAPLLVGTGPAAGDGDPDAARLRLFDAVTRLLESASQHRPVLLVLDDVQWADADSLRLLDYLTTELGDSRVLVLLTYRAEDARPGTALAAALGGLARRPDTVRLSLSGLSAGEVEQYTSRLTGHRLDPATIDLLVDRTSGNPFFLGEMVRLLSSERRLGPDDVRSLDIPSGVRDVVRRRVDRLPEDSQAVLRVAAVMGREFTVDELAAACDLDIDRLLDALDPPVLTALVEETGARGDRFRFSHALVGETLADDLAPTRRRRLHARIGRALEQVHARDLEGQSSRLAHHYAQAAALGHARTATRYAVLAAREAHRRAAFDEAARLWGLAHDLAVADDEADPTEVLDITIELASALAWVADAEGRSRSVEAIDRALALDDLDAAVRAACCLTEHSTTWMSAAFRDPEHEVVGRLDRVLDRLGPDDSPARARVLSVRSSVGYYQDPHRADEIIGEAVAIARRLDDDALLADCLLQRLCVHHRDNHDTLVSADELIEVARRLGSRTLEAAGLVSRVRARFALADLAGADADAETTRRLLAEHPAPPLAVQFGYYAVLRLLLDGRFDDAERAAWENDVRGRRMSLWGDERYLIQLFDIRFFQGRLGELGPVIDALAEIPDYGTRNFAVLVRLEDGRRDEALALLDRWGGIEAPRDDWRFTTEAVMATLVAAQVGDAAFARALYDEWCPRRGELANSGDLNSEGLVDTYLGLLARTFGDTALARRHLHDALALAVRLGSPTFEAQARAHLADVVDGDERLEHLGCALAIASDLGMRRIAQQVSEALDATVG